MDNYYLYIVIILLALAVVDLIVGVSNDAVNFLNSAIGSKVAPRYIILSVASLGIVVGSVMSSGMMEIARKGIFHPNEFYFSEIMIIFMAVMITDIVLIDFFNTFGLPTSTTVSLVFELLGASVAVAAIKISSSEGSFSLLSQYINTDKTLLIITGILVSIILAFIAGTVMMYISRILFSFNLKRTYHYFGAIFGGFAITTLTYFIVMKGVEGVAFVPDDTVAFIDAHTVKILLISFIGWAILLQLLSVFFRFNIFKIVVLLGTFALALSFAGNDLVNFIGVPLAGLKSFQIYMANPGVAPNQLIMSELAGAVNTNFYYLVIASLIMVITLWLSKKARTVTETEVALARQDTGMERFGSTQLSRSIVRQSLNISAAIRRITPKPVIRFIDSRFDERIVKKPKVERETPPSFDLIRASVNLTAASILISMATSIKLPLSTTYVTFMVAMGSSLADRAWGRESAVYRVTGVLTVISGWFFTEFSAFAAAMIVAITITFGGIWAIIGILAITAYAMFKSHIIHKKKYTVVRDNESHDEMAFEESTIMRKCIKDVREQLMSTIEIYNLTLQGISTEDRILLKKVNSRVEELNTEAKKLKQNLTSTLLKFKADSIDTGHFYVQVIDYIREIAHSLAFVTGPSYQHIDNNHKGFNKAQQQELKDINLKVSYLYERIIKMISDNDFTDIPSIINAQQEVLESINSARKNQVKRIKSNETGTRSSVLFLGILNESKNMLLQTINLLKAQRDFILNNYDD